MRKTEFLIIGQGISGTFLSWYLHAAGRPFLVIDNEDPASSSRVAAGIINPVTGRRIVQTWMIDSLLPFALKSYEEIGAHLGISAISRKNIIDFFPSPQMLNAFTERMNENDQYLTIPDDPSIYNNYFNYDFGFGEIDPCYIVHLTDLLPAWRKYLTEQNCMIEGRFNVNRISSDAGIRYEDIQADKIIFCDGVHAAENPWFRNLPFAMNKGEALVIRSKELPTDKIYKKGISLVPVKEDLFWTGSSHEWNFHDPGPSAMFLERTTKQLQQWLKYPFEIVAQLASVRPATVERRPFVGMHPHMPAIGILNGMGTKGCSLAPYFANQLVNHFTKNSPILPEANVDRFNRILKVSL